jgi:ribonuclease P/MRP protein subunit RPP40
MEEDVISMQQDINSVVKWCDKWLMKLNYSKCKIMHIGKNNPKSEYFMEDKATNSTHKLAKTESERDLGIQMTNKLKYNEQCTQAVTKDNLMLGILKQTFVNRDENTWKKIYTTYIRTHLEYAIQA